jgi:hypothetical protein
VREESSVPEHNEADTVPGEQPGDPQTESFQPDDASQPVEMQSPEGELPQPEEESQPADGAQPGQVEAEIEEEEPQSEQVERQEQVEPAPEPRRLSRAEQEAYERQRRRFAACGRCGYFAADCLVFLGEEAFQRALLDSRDGWVRLEGDETFRRLLSNAYGVELDVDFGFMDSSCPECRRRFVFVEREDGPTRLKIQI